MNIYKLKYKLDKIKLLDLFANIKHQCFFNFDNIDANNLKIYDSEFLGYNVIAETTNKRNITLLCYFDDDAILQLNNNINEDRIFEILENHFKENMDSLIISKHKV